MNPPEQHDRNQPPRSPDVVVVGGGLAGAGAGWRAASAGAEVVVVDDGGRRPPASTVAAGMIAPVGEVTWGEESLLDHALASAAAWPAFAERLADAAGLPVPYRRCGSVHVSLDRDEAAELGRRAELHQRHGLRSERLLGSECRALEPALATGVVGGISAPEEAEVDPRALLAALRSAAVEAGAHFETGRVESIDPEGGLVTVEGADERTAGTIVLAAGAWSGLEGLLGGRRLPVRPVKGEILRLRSAPGGRICERIIVGERFYLVPRASGELVVGGTVGELGFDLKVTAGGVHELLREAYRAVPELAELELAELGVGLRPGTPDNAPIIGRVGRSRVIVASGLYRSGVLLTPLLCSAFDALLAGESPPAELDGLGPGRFSEASRESPR
jgi:glycine oxidase